MEITLKLINEIASPEIVARGRAYFHDGRVQFESVENNLVRASVDGSDIYHVELHGDASGFEATCTCPFQWDGKCKHIVATMLATLYRNAKVEYTPLQAEQSRREERATTWIRDIEKLLTPSESDSRQEKVDAGWRLVYSLAIAKGYRYLYPIKLKLTKDGRDGHASILKRFDLFGDPHFDFLDRIIIERISNGFSNFVPTNSSAELPEHDEMEASWGMNDTIMGDVLSLLADKEVYLAHGSNYVFRRAYVHADPASVKMGISETEDGSLLLQPELHWGGQVHLLPANAVVLSIDTLWMLFDTNVVRLMGISAADFATMMNVRDNVAVPPSDRTEFMEEALPQLVKRFKVRSELSAIRTIEAEPRARLYLSEYNDKLNIQLRFAYDTVEVSELSTSIVDQQASSQELISDGNSFVYVHRKLDAEADAGRQLFDSMVHSYMRNDGTRHYFPSVNALDWLLTKLPVLQKKGFDVYGQENLKKHRLRSERPR
ncbi:MAG: SNF2 helicase associated domain-containing protein, partial [Ignavibacteriae bacterium]|nr:SNF2 helicase associated domain-containing protein [Ignavibacteriota bacterium]